MASELNRYYSDTEDEEEQEEDEDVEDDRELYKCNSIYRGACGAPRGTFLGKVLLEPRGVLVQEWNRMFLLVCATGLFVDPLFFYTLSISDNYMCLFVDGWFATTVMVLRCMTDVLHLWNMWLQFRVYPRPHVMGAREHSERSIPHYQKLMIIALRFLRAKRGLLFNLFVILPIPQIVLWVVVPALLKKGLITEVMTTLLIMFLIQYLPKIYHSICHLRRMQTFSGYIFGTVWWGIALNMIAYFVASHAVGACWYLLGIQRTARCLKQQCRMTNGCGVRMLVSEEPIYYGTTSLVEDEARLLWGGNGQTRSTCLSEDDSFYGAYKWTVQLVTNESRFEKILFPIFWGLMTLSTFGNLESTTDWLEVVFIIIVLTSGLLLVTMLIGNIKTCSFLEIPLTYILWRAELY